MASPSAAERVYFRIEGDLPQQDVINTPEEIELLNVPIKGLIRRVRFVAENFPGVPIAVNVNFALSEAPFSAGTYDPISGEFFRITLGTAAVQPPIDLMGDFLDDSLGVAAAGNQGIPFQLTPSSPGSKTGTLYLAWETSFLNPDTSFQITIEPLVP